MPKKDPDQTPVNFSVSLPQYIVDKLDEYCSLTKAHRSGAIHAMVAAYGMGQYVQRPASTAKK